MPALRIDLSKIEKDLADAQAAAQAALTALEKARQDFEEAKRNYDQIKSLMASLRRYAVDDDDDHPAGLPPGKYAGMSGAAAVADFVAEHPGAVMKLEEVCRALSDEGFDGTENAVGVALGGLANTGQVHRLRKGIYRFPEADQAASTDVDESHAVQSARHLIKATMSPEAKALAAAAAVGTLGLVALSGGKLQ